MAKDHASLQRDVKILFELYSWEVVENKKGQSARNYNSGEKGIADLLVVKPFSHVIWMEIKTPNDIQKPDQVKFEKRVTAKGHKYFLIYDVEQAKEVLIIMERQVNHGVL